MTQIAPTHINQCFADEVPLLDFQLDDSPTFYNQLDTWSKRVKEGFNIFNGVAEAYKSVCDATTNLNNAWELMLEQFDRSSLFLSSDTSFAPYSTIIDSMSSQMQEIQRYLKVRVDQMQDLTYNNLKKLAEERLKIESLDFQLKKTQETYFSALDKFGCTPAHDKNLVEFGESAMTSRRNYYILILKCVFSLRELYSSGIIEFSKSIIQDSLIHFTYFTNASNVYKNSEKEIGDFDSELRKAKTYCKSQVEADEKFHRMLRLEVTNKYSSDSISIQKLGLNAPVTPKHNKYDFSQANTQGSNSPVEHFRQRQNSFESLRVKTPHTQSDYTLNKKSSSQEDVNRVNHRTVTAYTQNMTPGTGSKKSPVLQRARFNTVMAPPTDTDSEPKQIFEQPRHAKLEPSNSNGPGIFRSKKMHRRFMHRINKRMSTLVKSSADTNASARSLDEATFRFSKNPSEDYNTEEDSRPHRLNSEATDSIPSIGTTSQLSPDQPEPPLEITSPYNVISTAIHRPPQEDSSFLMSEDYQKRVRPLHSFLKTGYLRQRPKGNFAIRTPKWPLVYCVIDKEEGWLRAGEMDGDGMYPLQNLMLSTVKKTDDVDRIHCFKILSPELEVTLQAFTPKDYNEWIAGLNEAIQYTLHNNQVVKWKSVKKNRSNRLSIIVSGEKPVKQEEAISRIKGVPGNQICADCGKDDPDWTSSNLGVAVCIDCSGVHRSLGVHVSKIRSIALDSWTDTLLLFMENKGNIKMNENFEQNLDAALKPKPDSSRKEKDIFITDKYVHLRFS